MSLIWGNPMRTDKRMLYYDPEIQRVIDLSAPTFWDSTLGLFCLAALVIGGTVGIYELIAKFRG
jgi:hypothetical protein